MTSHVPKSLVWVRVLTKTIGSSHKIIENNLKNEKEKKKKKNQQKGSDAFFKCKFVDNLQLSSNQSGW